VVFFCAEGRKRELAEALEAIGCRTMPFTFDLHGIRTWRV